MELTGSRTITVHDGDLEYLYKLLKDVVEGRSVVEHRRARGGYYDFAHRTTCLFIYILQATERESAQNSLPPRWSRSS